MMGRPGGGDGGGGEDHRTDSIRGEPFTPTHTPPRGGIAGINATA